MSPTESPRKGQNGRWTVVFRKALDCASLRHKHSFLANCPLVVVLRMASFLAVWLCVPLPSVRGSAGRMRERKQVKEAHRRSGPCR